MPYDLESVIYRLLEAKFVSETASGVGNSTTLVIIKPHGMHQEMSDNDIEKIKTIWKRTQKEPIPSDAMTVISKYSPRKDD